MKGVLDLSVVVPECDCVKTYRSRKEPGKMHRPGCKRLKAIKIKYGAA